VRNENLSVQKHGKSFGGGAPTSAHTRGSNELGRELGEDRTERKGKRREREVIELPLNGPTTRDNKRKSTFHIEQTYTST